MTDTSRADRTVSASHVHSFRRAHRPDCAVIIVTYNSARDIATLLDSLSAAAAGLKIRTVVVDNGSTDKTLEVARSRPDVTCIEARANLGYAGAINLGRMRCGEYSAVLVLNPDVELQAGALREMFTALQDPTVGMVAPKLLNPQGRRLPSLRREPTLMRAIGDCLLGQRLAWRPGWLSEMVWHEKSYGYRHSIDWATGAALLISADCDRAVGCWDERFFLYSEETDYATRARHAGFRVEYMPSALVHHRGSGSGVSRSLTALQAVNRIRYAEKHCHWPRLYRVVVILHEALRSGRPGHRNALFAVLRRSTWEHLLQNLRTTIP